MTNHFLFSAEDRYRKPVPPLRFWTGDPDILTDALADESSEDRALAILLAYRRAAERRRSETGKPNWLPLAPENLRLAFLFEHETDQDRPPPWHLVAALAFALGQEAHLPSPTEAAEPVADDWENEVAWTARAIAYELGNPLNRFPPARLRRRVLHLIIWHHRHDQALSREVLAMLGRALGLVGKRGIVLRPALARLDAPDTRYRPPGFYDVARFDAQSAINGAPRPAAGTLARILEVTPAAVCQWRVLPEYRATVAGWTRVFEREPELRRCRVTKISNTR